MVQRIGHDEVLKLLDQNAQLVEVLPAHEYHEQHIKSAISIPLTELDRQHVAGLDRERPIIVYCWDHQ